MKYIIFMLLLAGLGLQARAQEISEKKVPSVILNSFQLGFPQAKDVEWEMDQQHYKVEYELKDTDYATWLDGSGNILKTGHEIKEAELPAPVKTSIAQQYGAYDIDDVLQIEENNSVLYSVELEKGREEMTVLFNSDGSVKN